MHQRRTGRSEIFGSTISLSLAGPTGESRPEVFGPRLASSEDPPRRVVTGQARATEFKGGMVTYRRLSSEGSTTQAGVSRGDRRFVLPRAELLHTERLQPGFPAGCPEARCESRSRLVNRPEKAVLLFALLVGGRPTGSLWGDGVLRGTNAPRHVFEGIA